MLAEKEVPGSEVLGNPRRSTGRTSYQNAGGVGLKKRNSSGRDLVGKLKIKGGPRRRERQTGQKKKIRAKVEHRRTCIGKAQTKGVAQERKK